VPPKKSNTLTEAELRLMKILWRRGDSAVTDLVAAMPEGEPLAYNSVLTTIRILEQKGSNTGKRAAPLSTAPLSPSTKPAVLRSATFSTASSATPASACFSLF